jgi:hypothetical protein
MPTDPDAGGASGVAVAAADRAKVNAGDFFGQWSLALGPVGLPVTGGTVTAHGATSGLLSRTATGTFVATPD